MTSTAACSVLDHGSVPFVSLTVCAHRPVIRPSSSGVKTPISLPRAGTKCPDPVDRPRVIKRATHAQIDTEGKEAIDTFLVSYHGEPLDNNMSLLVTNALHYYLSLTELEKEESY